MRVEYYVVGCIFHRDNTKRVELMTIDHCNAVDRYRELLDDSKYETGFSAFIDTIKAEDALLNENAITFINAKPH